MNKKKIIIDAETNDKPRWYYRFYYFQKAFHKLEESLTPFYDQINANQTGTIVDFYSELELEGIIQRFEYTHELSWKVLKDYFEYQGINEKIAGPRDATRYGLKEGIINDDNNGKDWLLMIKHRNLTSHTYNKKTAHNIAQAVVNTYYHLFKNFNNTLISIANKI